MKLTAAIAFVLGCALITLNINPAYAQESLLYIGWDVNQPLVNTSWIDNTSSRGARVGFRKFIGDERRISVGLDGNWNYFQTYKPTETFITDNGALTTDYYNNIFQIAAVATGQYYFALNEKKVFFPYAGLGLGANRIRYSVAYNIYEDQAVSYGFLARPEVGLLIRIGERRRFGLLAAAHFDFSTARSSDYGYDNFASAGFQVGIVSLNW